MLKKEPNSKSNGKRILLIEDDFFVRDIYQKKFRDEGFLVDAASNGLEGLEMLKKSHPDVILLDIFMPYVDGKDVLRELGNHDEWKNIPVILLTNLADNEGVRFGFGQGAREFLIKSHFTPSEVVKKVWKVLEESEKDDTIKKNAKCKNQNEEFLNPPKTDI